MTVFLPPSPFYPGDRFLIRLPLDRYLPPYRIGTVSAWLSANRENLNLITTSGLILDPFGGSPLMCLEAANNGFPLIVCANNPINRLLIECLANPPQREEMLNIVAEISSIKKLDLRLESFIRSLYLSLCNFCNSEVEVEAFIWEKTTTGTPPALIAKKYKCPSCGQSGEFPATAQDQQNLSQLPPTEIFMSQALNRVIAPNEPEKEAVQDAIQTYIPRTLFGLITLINKLDMENHSTRRDLLLKSLFILIFEATNTLSSPSSRRYRPKQLFTPAQIYEPNLWLTLETAAQELSSLDLPFKRINVVYWPATPQPGEICIYDGRVKDFLRLSPKQNFSAVLASIPRPNQAFWTLSALWTGWFFGRDAVTPFKSALKRRRYDWGWHCRALYSSFQEISKHCQTHLPFFGLIDEYESNYLAATLIAGEYANFSLSNFAFRENERRAQIQWFIPQSGKPTFIDTRSKMNPDQTPLLQKQITQAIKGILQRTGEPISSNGLHAVALINVIHHDHPEAESRDPKELSLSSCFDINLIGDFPNYFNHFLQQSTSSEPDLTTLNTDDKRSEARLWTLRKNDFIYSSHSSFSDQIESAVIKKLQEQRTISFTELDQWICQYFAGVIAPSSEYLEVCLSSYAQSPDSGKSWNLRQEDYVESRQKDISEIISDILSLGEKLGFQPEVSEEMILWIDKSGVPSAQWRVRTTAALKDLLIREPHPSLYLAIPGGRVNLLLYKIKANPIYQQHFSPFWRIIRFRQIRWLIQQPNINLQLFEESFTFDPLNYENPQLQLL
jgi:hypothetical protein